LRSTPPYTNIVLDAVARWHFTPAQMRTDGKDVTVNGSVLIAAIYRPPTLMNGPTLGERPRDLANASSNSPYPVSTVVPAFPTQARMGSVLLYEVSLDEVGRIANVRGIGADPGFDSAAKDALIQWKFRGGSVAGRPAASTVYVVFGFASPVIGAAGQATPVTSPPPPPVPQLPLPPAK
jgi:hypothetical protein